ncbi:MAG TPA: hypothetical protein VFS39_15225 [Nitrospira sp.]|nr:hypothetical protein [Nitrospira sp.]
MHDLTRYALLSVVLLAPGPVWGGEEVWQAKPKPAETSIYQGTVTPTVDASPITPLNVWTLTPGIDRPRTEGILGSATWLKGAFTTETEIAANQGMSTGDESATRMMRLGVTGSTGVVRYGLTYRKAGQAFAQASDQDLREAWGEWKTGPMAIRSTFGQQSNNVDADPTRPRIEQHYNRLGVSWNKAMWPRLELTYAQNATNSTLNPAGVAPQKANQQSVEAAVSYGGTFWDAKLASAYGLTADPRGDGHVQSQTVTASLHPLSSLTITPTLGYRVEQYEWSSTRLDSPSASLAMNYQQNRRLSVSAVGSYSTMRSSDRLVDMDTIGGKGVLAWQLEPVRDWKPQVSVEGGYNLQVNRLMPSAQTENLSGLLRLVLATM